MKRDFNKPTYSHWFNHASDARKFADKKAKKNVWTGGVAYVRGHIPPYCVVSTDEK